jgi:hypothetical protein
MEGEADTSTFKGLVRWAMTPPQAYAVYVLALLLVYGVSYYAGTLNPKKAPPSPPPAVTTPQR